MQEENNDLTIDEDWLILNPMERLPIILCLDTSEKMGESLWDEVCSPIELRCEGIAKLHRDLIEDERASTTADLCILTFGGGVSCIKPFGPLDAWTPPPTLKAAGETYLATALLEAKKLLDERLLTYWERGIPFLKPWLILMSDGILSARDIPNAIHAQQWLQVALGNNPRPKLTLMAFFMRSLTHHDLVGEDTCMAFLRSLYPRYSQWDEWPRRLSSVNRHSFSDFFTWLSGSIQAGQDQQWD